jgi:alpha-galactosidase
VITIPIRNYSPFPDWNTNTFKRYTATVRPPTNGWCSWSAYGTDINEIHILDTARCIHNRHLPIKHILIDDGWTRWGDWDNVYNAKFPHKMKWLSTRIRRLGFIPGLWIAPFLVDPSSTLATRHPDWLIKDDRNQFVEGRRITPWDRYFPFARWILDYSRTEAKQYIHRCINTIIRTWNFPYLKLDFLYAQHWNPHFTQSQEPDGLLHDFLSEIRTSNPDVYISACGCPLLPAVGLVDAMRISEDIVNPQLKHLFPWNTIIHTMRLQQLQQNISARYGTRKFWSLDPDVFVCDPTFGFSERQILKLSKMIIHTQGIRFLGDNIVQLPPKRIDTFLRPFLYA